jgi:osmotically-inducible protein OsmY
MNQTMDDLHAKVQRALVDDSRTRDYGVEELNKFAVIIMRGRVPSRAARDTIEAVVREVNGVRSVNDEMDVMVNSL